MARSGSWGGVVGAAGILALSAHCGGATNVLPGYESPDGSAADAGGGSGGGSGGPSSGSSSGASGSGGSSGAASGSGSGASGSGSGASGSGSGGSGSSSGVSGSSSGTSGSSSGSPTCAPPNTAATCTSCQTGSHTCQPNGCYGGYYCDTTTNKCKSAC